MDKISNMSLNKHIIENLDYYLSVNEPEYAFLLSGDWGTGKTYFMNSYIKKYNEEHEGRIIKISLFGLSKTSHIDEKIFQEIHPILSHKYTKLAGNILKGAFKLGFKIDLDGEAGESININTSLDKINTSDISSSDAKNNEIIIALDDLERTDIPLKEILGYINYLVEISKIKVILIANENKFLAINNFDASKSIEDKKNDGVYEEFKEKVIGKTFEVKQNFDDVLTDFLKSSKFEKLIDFKHVIKHVYTLSSIQNLRNIKQAILDFNYLVTILDEKYVSDNNFTSVLIRNFFALTIEIKNGGVNEQSLRSEEPLMKKNIVTGVENNISKKYSLHETPLYSGELWADILFKGDLSNLNEETSKLVYFIEKSEKQKPLWLRLWFFATIDDEDEFVALSDSLLTNFTSLKEEDPAIYLHNLALLIYFSKNKLLEISIDEIKKLVLKYLEKYDKSSIWNQSRTYPFSYFNQTGYAYYNDTDEDFIEQRKLIDDKINTEKQKTDQDTTNHEYEDFLLAIKTGNIKIINQFFIEKYQFKPVFASIDSEEFTQSLLQASNSTINHIDMILYERYFSNTSLNGKPLHQYFNTERSFWEKVYSSINNVLNEHRGIKFHNLQQMNEFKVAKIMVLLED